jgi:hypothetical protein
MVKAQVRPGSILAAVLLSTLTLGVFAIQANSGPENTVRRFHEGVLRNNPKEVAAFLVQPIEDYSSQVLVRRLQSLAQLGATMDVTRIVRQQNRAIVDVRYTLQNGQIITMLWVTQLDRGVWKVNAIDTLAIIEKMMRS